MSTTEDLPQLTALALVDRLFVDDDSDVVDDPAGKSKHIQVQDLLNFLITSGSGVPSVAPVFIGQQYIDTAADKVYIGTDTSVAGDFKILN